MEEPYFSTYGRPRREGAPEILSIDLAAGRAPIAYAKLSAPITQRDVALRYMGGSAPRPLLRRARQAQITWDFYSSVDE